MNDPEGDDLDDMQREELHRALDEGLAQPDAGDVVPASVVLAELRAQTNP